MVQENNSDIKLIVNQLIKYFLKRTNFELVFKHTNPKYISFVFIAANCIMGFSLNAESWEE